MKLKLAISLAVPALIMLGASGCVTTATNYASDIVYRDGSYYSPADEQYGDYYYAPEPDYSYYDDYPYYGYGSGFYTSPWYSGYNAYQCSFSYRYDRYCNGGWGDFFFNFGGLTLILGNSNYYGYGYGYGYPYYGYYDPYPYSGHHPHHPEPDHHGPIPMPKPVRPGNQTPDLGINNNPGMRVPGEPIRMPMKPGLVDRNEVEPVDQPINEPDRRTDLNPYTRTRQPRPSVRPEIFRNASGQNDNEQGIAVGETEPQRPVMRERAPPRARPRPLPIVDAGDGSGGSYEKPVRQDRTQPYPVIGGEQRDAQPAPRQQTRERVERVERSERSDSERSAPAIMREPRKDSGDDR